MDPHISLNSSQYGVAGCLYDLRLCAVGSVWSLSEYIMCYGRNIFSRCECPVFGAPTQVLCTKLQLSPMDRDENLEV